MKFKIKTGDDVIVTAGKDKGKRGDQGPARAEPWSCRAPTW